MPVAWLLEILVYLPTFPSVSMSSAVATASITDWKENFKI